jgi:nucleoside 2-deoxyribosyltransferase
MKLYLAIKYHANQRNRPVIERIAEVMTAQGHDLFCIARDLEQWGALSFPADKLMQYTFQIIASSDVVLVDLTEKGIGLGIEAGYAHALGIPVVTIAQTGTDISETLRGIATTAFQYTDYTELAHLPLSTPNRQSKAITLWRFSSRSVERLLACLDGLEEAALNWRPLPSASSLYMLATHIIGNIEETVLGVICGHKVVRDRDAEFSAIGSDTAALWTRWQQLETQIIRDLAHLTPIDLDRPRLHPRRGMVSSWEILIVVARHAAEHLAHAELTRDLLLATHEEENTLA